MTQLISRTFLLLLTLTYFSITEKTRAVIQTRSLRGEIYYTNNTPSNLGDFPVELFTPNQKTRVAETTLDDSGHFFLEGIKAGRYILTIKDLGSCTLLYRVDLRAHSITSARVIMDAECAHNNGKLTDLPKN